MDLALLRTFLTVYRVGSFTRAATLLGLSQPTVTSQIRTLERQLDRPLFIRGARGVTPTSVSEELAHKAAPHLDALLAITEADLDATSPTRTLHLTGPPEFTGLRALPALAPLAAQGVAVRATFGTTDACLDGLAAGHHDLAISTTRPRGRELTATPLCDEEYVLVTTPHWAAGIGGSAAIRAKGAQVLDSVPVISVHETLPLLAHYWSTVFDRAPERSGAIIVPDLRGVLECVLAGAGLAVLPRYLCRAALNTGEVVSLLDPPVPPLRTYFLAIRAGTLALPHIARAHDRLLRAAVRW
jgi:DNA-binding transcriptional LysR family regulator